MKRVLVLQGAGMDRRGLEDVDVFGPETLAEINAAVEDHARDLGMAVTIIQTNDEATAAGAVRSADPAMDALIINPAGFTTTGGPLVEAIREAPFPAFEVHASNPAVRGIRSEILPACQGGICGFGYAGYRLALEAIAAL